MKIKPFRKKPNIKQRFSSGNAVDVYIEELAPRVYDGRVEWDNFPPSQRDAAEYIEKVVPRLNAEMDRLKAQNN